MSVTPSTDSRTSRVWRCFDQRMKTRPDHSTCAPIFAVICQRVWQLKPDWQHHFPVFSTEMCGFRNCTVVSNKLLPCWLLIQPLTNIIIVTVIILSAEKYCFNGLWKLESCFCSVFTPLAVFTSLWRNQHMALYVPVDAVVIKKKKKWQKYPFRQVHFPYIT